MSPSAQAVQAANPVVDPSDEFMDYDLTLTQTRRQQDAQSSESGTAKRSGVDPWYSHSTYDAASGEDTPEQQAENGGTRDPLDTRRNTPGKLRDADGMTRSTARALALGGKETAAITAKIAGTRIGVALDDVLKYAQAEVAPWLNATIKLCETIEDGRAETLQALVQPRCDAIQQQMNGLYRIARAVDYLDSHRASLRATYRKTASIRNQARRIEDMRVANQKHDAVTAELLETERRRAEAIAESIRIALGQCSAARALYAQVDALIKGG